MSHSVVRLIFFEEFLDPIQLLGNLPRKRPLYTMHLAQCASPGKTCGPPWSHVCANPQTGATLRRGDIKVHHGGPTHGS